MSCITDNKVIGLYGHESQYIGKPGYTELEIFADVFAALYQGDDETVSFIKMNYQRYMKHFLKYYGDNYAEERIRRKDEE